MSDVEQILNSTREVFVYKIPPRQSSTGYKAEDWEGNMIWKGRCMVVGRGPVCEIRLEDPSDGSLFATCIVNTAPGAPQAVERVVDSSRYFVLRIEDGSGRHAFIGLGFQERADAFDFQVSIQDYSKRIQREQEPAPDLDKPTEDFSLAKGQSIHVDIKGKVKPAQKATGTGAGTPTSAGSGSGLSKPPGSSGGRLLAPPPGSSGSGAKKTDDWTDFSGGAKSAGSTAAGNSFF